jgi:drug/metabolite transporter (DMT)-like permease
MWIPLTLAAGTLQTVRNSLAHGIAREISPALNSWSRFGFNLPFSTLLIAGLVLARGAPSYSLSFFLYCLGTGVTQLVGNIALVAAFRRGSFAEAIVLHKLEVVFAALVGVLFFAEVPAPVGWIGIFACTAGTLFVNVARTGGLEQWRRAASFGTAGLLSLTSGIMLVLASFFLKAATRDLAAANERLGPGSFEGAAHTLFHTTWIEVAILSVYLAIAAPSEYRLVPRHWRRMAAIGMAGFAGSLCWFWAYSIALVAYVKAVGQIETVLSVALGLIALRETHLRRQLPGIALILGGIVLVLVG